MESTETRQDPLSSNFLSKVNKVENFDSNGMRDDHVMACWARQVISTVDLPRRKFLRQDLISCYLIIAIIAIINQPSSSNFIAVVAALDGLFFGRPMTQAQIPTLNEKFFLLLPQTTKSHTMHLPQRGITPRKTMPRTDHAKNPFTPVPCPILALILFVSCH